MSRILLQTGFHTVQHSLLRVMVMMIGELDFGSIFIDSIGEYRNDNKERPLNPFPQVGFFFIFLCLILLAIALMNLLVRKLDSISFRLHNRMSFWSATLPIFVKSMFFLLSYVHLCGCGTDSRAYFVWVPNEKKDNEIGQSQRRKKNPVVLKVKARKLAKARSSKLFFCFRSVWLLGILSKWRSLQQWEDWPCKLSIKLQ